MAEQKENVLIAGRVPPVAKTAIRKAIDKGLAANESDYVRKSVINELRRNGLL